MIGGVSYWVGTFDDLDGTGGVDEELIIETLPDVPDLSAWPTELIRRLETAHLQLMDEGSRLPALIELARLYHANGFNSQAHSCYLLLSAIQTGEAEWPYMIAVLRSDYSDQQEVIELLARAIRLDPTWSLAHWRMGETYMKLERWGLASEAFNKRLEWAPEDPWALIGLARIAFQQGRFQESEARLLQAITADPNLPNARRLLPDVYQELEDPGSARESRDHATKLGEDRWPVDPAIEALIPYCYNGFRLRDIALEAIQKGEIEAARMIYERACDVDSLDVESRFLLARLCRDLGDYDCVESRLTEVVTIGAYDPEPYLVLAHVLVEKGQNEKAMEALAMGIERFSGEAALYQLLGDLLREEGRIEDAKLIFDRVKAILDAESGFQ